MNWKLLLKVGFVMQGFLVLLLLIALFAGTSFIHWGPWWGLQTLCFLMFLAFLVKYIDGQG